MRLGRLEKKKVALFTVDLALIITSFLLTPYIRFGRFGWSEWSIIEAIWGAILILSVNLLVFYIVDIYKTGIGFRGIEYLFRHFLAVAAVGLLLSVTFFFSPIIRPRRGDFLIFLGLMSLSTYLWRVAFEWWDQHVLRRKKELLIVGAGRAGKALYEEIRDIHEFNIAGFIDDDPLKKGCSNPCDVLGGTGDLKGIIENKGIDVVIMAVRHLRSPDLMQSLLDCKMRGIEVYDMPDFYEELTGKIPVEHVNDAWFISAPIFGVKKSVYNPKVKRMVDLTLSLAGLVLSLPVTIMTALAVKLDSSGPVFYWQKRIGRNDKPFYLVKFRSMTVGTENDRRFAGNKDDPRVTRVGRIIRLFRIDEIPQMWNVLKGEMSFIGPRPLMEEEVREFEGSMPYFSLRHSVRPGITGWAQISHKHGVSVEDALERLHYDLFYIKNLSPILDLHVLVRTVKVVLSGRGAR